jgi:uncharacterized membrane protein YgcG
MVFKNITDFLKNLFGLKPSIDEPKPIEPRLLKELTVPRAPRHEPTPYGRYSDIYKEKKTPREVRTHNSYNPAVVRDEDRVLGALPPPPDYVTPIVVGSIIAQESYAHEDRPRTYYEEDRPTNVESNPETYSNSRQSTNNPVSSEPSGIPNSVPDTSYHSPSPLVSESYSSGSSYSSPSFDSGSSYSSSDSSSSSSGGGSDSGGW